MEKFVYKYLSANYTLSTVEESSRKLKLITYDAIYHLKDEDDKAQLAYYNTLLKELVLIFYEDEVTLKKWVNKWAKSLKPNVNLKWYWSHDLPWLPIAHKIAAQTIGMDLVAVAPMIIPKGIVTYGDFIYSSETPNENGRIYQRAEMVAFIQELFDRQQNEIIGVSSRETTPEEKSRHTWGYKL
jgi:hypothetical protein